MLTRRCGGGPRRSSARVLLTGAAALIRERKFEFDAWLVVEAGKTWPEAEAEVGEAIDFCEYYARQMVRFAAPEAVVQMPGERDELVYLPLGAGVIIPPWNFPLAILAGMTVAALVAGNTVVIKPSSETPTIAAKFVEVLHEAGFPPRSLALCTGSGAVIGDLLVEHPKTRFVSFTGSREVGLRINELAAKPRKGQIWIKRVVAEMGGKDAIIVDREADLDSAVAGVVQSAFGYQGQKCSACSRAIVDDPVYDEFVEKLEAKVAALTVGAPGRPRELHGAGDQRGRAQDHSRLHRGRARRRAADRGRRRRCRATAISCSRRCSPASNPRRAFFRKRFSGRCWRSPARAISATRWNWRTTPNTA